MSSLYREERYRRKVPEAEAGYLGIPLLVRCSGAVAE